MAFKKAPPVQNVPDSPEKLFLELPRRKIPGVLLHQGEMMRAYQQQALDVSDVALQLPTGSGKTLVGLMIAEWRRRKNKERILYLCPTKQLVNQVVEQANEQYGLLVNGFTGSANSYNQTAKSQYQNADRVAVTTYSALFNTNPFFKNPEVIILDDAHAAENYIAALWSLKIERNNPEHQNIHNAISSLVKSHIEPINFVRLTGENKNLSDATWVDKLPTPTLHEIKNELCAIIDTHAPSDLQHAWKMIREHLSGCHLYLSSQEILIRPLLPPTWNHAAFNDAQQRIFMSATLGAGGDLERLTGRKNILRLPVPTGWDRQGIGRRYFIFPSLSLDNEIPELQRKMIEEAGKSIILVPAEKQKKKIEENLQELSGFRLFNAKNIEESKKSFIESDKAVAVIANRYDGIDFPGDDCRLLFIDGLPRTTNSQEKFLMSKMGANVLFNERIQTRVLQAIGRCTRSLQDYSAVVVTGEHLPDYLVDRKRRDFFHPELQAELEFGVEQSQETNIENIIDNFKIFLSNGTEWEEANTQILDKKSIAEQKSFPAMEELIAIAGDEIEFQRRMWQGDYDRALQAAENVIAGLTSPELKGYRALWHYLAGSSAWKSWKSGRNGNNAHLIKSSEHYKKSKEAAPNIPWLVSLSKYQSNNAPDEKNNLVLLDQVERLKGILTSLGTVYSRKYEKRVKEILDGLNDPKKFENAHKLLGELLGFDEGKEESDASPDPWWIVGNICFVFEDHAGAKLDSKLGATKARQVASHPEWIKEKLGISSKTHKIIPVLVSPVKTAHKGAKPHLSKFYYWELEDFKSWAKTALSVIRELRTNFVEAGDFAWCSEACTKLSSAKLDGENIEKMILQSKASDKLNS